MGVNVKRKNGANSRTPAGPKTDGFFKVHIKQAKASFSELWQRPLGNILTLAVISMALAMPSCLYLIGKNIALAASKVANPSQVSVYLSEQVTDAKAMVLKDKIEGWSDVKTVKYISPQQGLADLSKYSGFDQAISLLDDYSLPGVLEVVPNQDTKQATEQLAQKIKGEQDVTDVRLDEDWLARLDAIRAVVLAIVITLSILMLGSVFLIVGNTLRFNVLANKEEIQTMKLIGATDSYILRPYLYSGLWFGFLGALIAWVLTFIITILLESSVDQLSKLYDSQFSLVGLGFEESIILLMLGIFLGGLAAKVSAQRHLREIEPV
ncbi:permease-like cell division protein FtsX [Vibrio sp. S4M6]|uniref:permease-like cell division protein FtsX n=1 Tax=Vibrio sinus TaxID=2946865 RepID=UPI002029BB03|nr:permease-like cell division protein FtsX [Vibrio sinus]MCL9783567.1 permease-like cell division protein FtsX [Vibrio sinus]